MQRNVPEFPMLPRHGRYRSFLPFGRNRHLAAGGPPNPDPSHPVVSPLVPSNSIHEELDSLLTAFSLFRPVIPSAFKLFRILYVNPDPEHRHKKPMITVANFLQICEDYLEELVAGTAANLRSSTEAVAKLVTDMKTKVETQQDISEVTQGSATEQSLLFALKAGILGVAGAQIERKRVYSASRDISVTVSQTETYNGYKLRKLMWQNAEMFFRMILETIESDFTFQIGQRRLMAIVTKKIIADISISREASSERGFGVGVGGPEGTLTLELNNCISAAEHENNHAFGGIAGIHFLMFPIERIAEFVFRVRPGVNVNGLREDEGPINRSTQATYERWHNHSEQEEDAPTRDVRQFTVSENFTHNLSTSSGDQSDAFPVTLQRNVLAHHWTESELLLAQASVTKAISLNNLTDRDFVLFRPDLNGVTYKDIDLAPMLNDFAMRQVARAKKLWSNTDQTEKVKDFTSMERRALALSLVRSALRKGCYQATLCALQSLAIFYRSKFRYVSNRRARLATSFCVVRLRNVYESSRAWLRILNERASLQKCSEPEELIIEIVATPSVYSFTHYSMLKQLHWVSAIRPPDGCKEMIACSPPRKFGGNSVKRHTFRGIRLNERAVEYLDDAHTMLAPGKLEERSPKGVKRNDFRTAQLCMRAIGKHDVRAMVNLGDLLLRGGLDIQRDAVRAMELYMQAVHEHNDVTAMIKLGVLLTHGAEGVKCDAARAVELYERAIYDHNDVDAMYNLAVLTTTGGHGVKRNVARAATLYERAIDEHDDPRAMVNLAGLLTQGGEGIECDPVRASELYEHAIREHNAPKAMVNLGVLLTDGGEDVEQNVTRAIDLYQRAVKDHNDVDAMYNLAVLESTGGHGVKRDLAHATTLYERAMEERDDPEAMVNLAAILTFGGEGVERNMLRAKELYERAIGKCNDVDAICNLAVLQTIGGYGVKRDIVHAAELYQCAIEEHNDPEAMVNLAGLLTLGGEGVERNTIRAKELYERAIKEYLQRDVGEHSLPVLVTAGGLGVKRDVSRAAELYKRAIQEHEDPKTIFNFGGALMDYEENSECEKE